VLFTTRFKTWISAAHASREESRNKQVTKQGIKNQPFFQPRIPYFTYVGKIILKSGMSTQIMASQNSKIDIIICLFLKRETSKRCVEDSSVS
jgi:hypothetical protein